MTTYRLVCLLLAAAVLIPAEGCATARRMTAKTPIEKPEMAAAEAEACETVVDPLLRGYQLEAAENWPEAIAFYGAVLRDQPANSVALHRMAVIATYREDYESAANYYRRARELDPKNASLLADAGYFLTLQKQYEPAALMLEMAVLLDPENERAINNLATVKAFRGEIDAALVLFRRVNPPAEALQCLAEIHEQRGEWQLALACYYEAKSADSTVAVPENVLAKVDELRHPPELPTEVLAIPAEPESAIAAPTFSAATAAPPPSRPLARGWVPTESSVLLETTPAPGIEIDGVLQPFDHEMDFFPTDHVAIEDSVPVTEELISADWEQDISAAGDAAVEAVSATIEPTVLSEKPSRLREAALNGCCPVALRDQSQLVDGQPEFCWNHESMLYTFSSAEAVQRFRLNPERYIPSAGGLDVISVRAGKMERGNLHYSTWFRNRLFLFTSAGHVDEFRSDPLRYVELN